MTQSDLCRHVGERPNERKARVTIDASRRGDPVDERLFGKFCEHLGRNIYGGMHAQVLLNPTFGPWEFSDGAGHPDGGVRPKRDDDEIRSAIRGFCDDWDLPDPEPRADAYLGGTAFGWVPTDGVRTTPDVSPTGDRAQRVVLDDGGGLLQRTHLPLHRTRSYEFELRLRATVPTTVEATVREPDDGDDPVSGEVLAAARFDTDREWSTHEATLDVDPSDAADDEAYVLTLVAADGVDLVFDRATLYPDDHVDGADPEVVEYLREADLPLLRWPGGNFASGSDWRDGVGPIDERPSTVNPAWGRGESNLFGTAEFIAFCDAVGCEPMICVNAGDGTPAEAAAWVEYCNGSTDTEMGALRAEHGHPEPYDVTRWEIGNELYGQWQVGWTTPSGNADRYVRFRDAMREVDPSIEVQACGHRASPENRWNDALLEAAGDEVRCLTDHLLTGGSVHAGTDPGELFRGFVSYADQIGREYRALRDRMRAAGVEDPRVAITELQLFAHFREDPSTDHHGSGLTAETMPTPATVSEALYLATIVNECVRLGEFVEMLTHSATVNHGGGLRKRRQRTWAQPVHYGHVLLAPLAGGTPLGVDLACATIGTDTSFGDIEAVDGVPAVDAMAVRDAGGDAVHVVLVNRRSGRDPDPIECTLEVGETTAETAEVTRLAGETMHAENTYETPDRVSPETDSAAIREGRLALTLSPYSLTRVTIPRGGAGGQ